MEQFLAQDIKEDLRWDFLLDNADSVEEIGYMRRFSSEELLQKKELLSELSLEIKEIEERKHAAMQKFKESLKPLIDEKNEILESIKNGSEYIENEKCVKIFNRDENMAGYYNKLGELVYSRPIMPYESQTTIFSIKTGTDD